MPIDPRDVDWRKLDDHVDLFIDDMMEDFDIPGDFVVKTMLQKAIDHHLETHGTLSTMALLGHLIQQLAEGGPMREMVLMRRLYN